MRRVYIYTYMSIDFHTWFSYTLYCTSSISQFKCRHQTWHYGRYAMKCECILMSMRVQLLIAMRVVSIWVSVSCSCCVEIARGIRLNNSTQTQLILIIVSWPFNPNTTYNEIDWHNMTHLTRLINKLCLVNTNVILPISSCLIYK